MQVELDQQHAVRLVEVEFHEVERVGCRRVDAFRQTEGAAQGARDVLQPQRGKVDAGFKRVLRHEEGIIHVCDPTLEAIDEAQQVADALVDAGQVEREQFETIDRVVDIVQHRQQVMQRGADVGVVEITEGVEVAGIAGQVVEDRFGRRRIVRVAEVGDVEVDVVCLAGQQPEAAGGAVAVRKTEVTETVLDVGMQGEVPEGDLGQRAGLVGAIDPEVLIDDIRIRKCPTHAG